MDAHRFDRIAKTLAGRFSRRGVLVAGGGGITVGLLGPARPAGTAQDATPQATPDASPAASPAAGAGPELLFVQVFAAGTWTPKPDTDGVYLLTLTGHAAQTVYFSDRPDHLVGTVPTRAFLDRLGFTPADPPNAAVVAQTPDGGEAVLVVELFDPVYAEGFGEDGGVSVTYAARVLIGDPGEHLAPLAARQSDGILPETFGPASLFIDAPAGGCPRGDVQCEQGLGGPIVGRFDTNGYCWQVGYICCQPCSNPDWKYWEARCNQTFPECDGRCRPLRTATCF